MVEQHFWHAHCSCGHARVVFIVRPLRCYGSAYVQAVTDPARIIEQDEKYAWSVQLSRSMAGASSLRVHV